MSFGNEELVQLARLALTGRQQDVGAYLRRLVRKAKPQDRQIAELIGSLLATAPTPINPLRDAGGGMLPIDVDSRLSLLRQEFPVHLGEAPIFPPALRGRLDQVLSERRNLEVLAQKGLEPTKSLLFVGPPGVGKTMSARWVAESLGVPLLTLDLAAVMSSYLGKTGSNLRNVLDYAKSLTCVLLLDEFDAVAKRRDDESEIGELKRLVTVLLQEIDDWPETSLLIAATNHEELLDPAAWRRFDDVLRFDLPPLGLRVSAIEAAFADDRSEASDWLSILAEIWAGRSFSDVGKSVQRIRRRATVGKIAMPSAIIEEVSEEARRLTLESKRSISRMLRRAGVSDHKINDITGISRDTLRKMWASEQSEPGGDNGGAKISDRRRRATVGKRRAPKEGKR